jgi:hypothetical protein
MTLVAVVKRLQTDWRRELGHEPASPSELLVEAAFLEVIIDRSLAMQEQTAARLTSSDPVLARELRTWLAELAQHVAGIMGVHARPLPRWPTLALAPRPIVAPPTKKRTLAPPSSPVTPPPPPPVVVNPDAVQELPSFAGSLILPARSSVLWMLDQFGGSLSEVDLASYLAVNAQSIHDACELALRRHGDLSAVETAMCAWILTARVYAAQMPLELQLTTVREIIRTQLSRAAFRQEMLSDAQYALVFRDELTRRVLFAAWCAPYVDVDAQYRAEFVELMSTFTRHVQRHRGILAP